MDSNNNGQKIYFDKVKKDRGDYFVEYSPPSPLYRFANLALIFPNEIDSGSVANAMEKEVKDWIKKYPIPVMASSFDNKGDLYHLKNIRNSDFLIGYFDKSNEEIRIFWKTLQDTEIPDDALDIMYLKTVYSDIPFTTSQELQRKRNKKIKQIRTG